MPKPLSNQEIMSHWKSFERNDPGATSEDLVEMVVQVTRSTYRRVCEALRAELGTRQKATP